MLTRSLFTLFTLALLAAAYARVTEISEGVGGKCRKFLIEVPRSPYAINGGSYDFTMMSDGTYHPYKDVPNYCSQGGEEIAVEIVEVCNDYPHAKMALFPPPNVRVLGEETVSPIYASCGDNTECGPLLWRVQLQCKKPLRH